MTGDWIMLTVLWVVTAALCVAGARPVTDAWLARWTRRFDVVLDAVAAQWVRPRLRRARTIRWCSLAVGVNISGLPAYANVIDGERASSFSNPATSSALFLAPALGAVLAELLVVQRPVGGPEAVLVRRQWSDYIHRFWLAVIAVCAPVSVGAAIATRGGNTDAAYAWVGPFAVGIAVAATTLGTRHILNRPALAADGPMRSADDGRRADGIHHVAGASVALAVSGTCATVLIAAQNAWWALPFVMFNYVAIAWWARLSIAEPWSVQHARAARA